MSNPYQPPETESENHVSITDLKVSYRGGWIAIMAIGLLGGLVVIFVMLGQKSFLNPFVTIGFIWLAAISATAMLLRGADHLTGLKVMMTLVALPIGVCIYIPVCTAGSMMVAGTYNVSERVAIPVSAACFAAVLLLLSAMLRSHMQKRVNAGDPHSATISSADLPTSDAPEQQA